MRDFNFWTFTGNLTRDPQLHHLDDGTPVCHFSVGMHTRRKEDQSMYINVTSWRDAEHCAAFLKKGSRVFITGILEASIVTLKDGRNILDLSVDAREIEFMDRAPAEVAAAQVQG